MRGNTEHEARVQHWRARPVTRLLALLLLAASPVVADESRVIDATVLLFDDGLSSVVPGDVPVFPAVRRVEAVLLSYSLSRRLRASDAFGVVRLAARPDELTELTVTGRIVIADGARIVINVAAQDSLGQLWVSRQFESAMPDTDAMIEEIATAIEAASVELDRATIERLRETALLRYGRRLAPTAFGDYFDEDANGNLTLRRLPSKDDPMVQRLLRVREATFLVSDVIDEKFNELGTDISDVYTLWGQYLEKNRDYQAENRRRAEDTPGLYDPGTFEAYKRVYDVYKWHRQTVQEQDRLAVAFGNEVNPKLGRMQERVDELLTWMDSKNAEWYRLLEALFDVETRRETL